MRDDLGEMDQDVVSNVSSHAPPPHTLPEGMVVNDGLSNRRASRDKSGVAFVNGHLDKIQIHQERLNDFASM